MTAATCHSTEEGHKMKLKAVGELLNKFYFEIQSDTLSIFVMLL